MRWSLLVALLCLLTAGDARAAMMAHYDLAGLALESDAIVVATEWAQFKDLDMGRVRLGMKGSHLLVDGRNVFEPREMKELGFVYVGIGR